MTNRRIWAALVPALLAAGCSKGAPAAPDPKELFRPGAKPPAATLVWPVPDDPLASIQAAGLQPLVKEGDIWHLHFHLEVFKDGKQVLVPQDIGVGPQAAYYSPIHTHTPDGVVHVESNEVRDYTLGQFFAQWGVPLTGARVRVNDELAPDPEKVVFRDFDLITVIFGDEP